MIQGHGFLSRLMIYKESREANMRAPGRTGMVLYASFVGLSTISSLTLPNEAGEYPKLLLQFADAVSVWVPSVDSFAGVSAFPYLTKVLLAVQWAVVPVLVLLISLQPELVRPNERTLRTSSRLKVIALLAAVVALFVVYPAIIQVSPEDLQGGMLHERALRSASRSRLWLGLIGSTVIFTVAYFSALVLSYLRALVSRS